MKFSIHNALIYSLVITGVNCLGMRGSKSPVEKPLMSSDTGAEDFMAGWPEEDIIEFRQYYA
jgi:hypothetical protein